MIALPPGWEQRFDPQSRRVFWYDHNRCESHWTPPFAVAAPPPALPPGWEQKYDPANGRVYWYDHNTRQSHWNPPFAVVAAPPPPAHVIVAMAPHPAPPPIVLVAASPTTAKKSAPPAEKKSGFTVKKEGAQTADMDVRNAHVSIKKFILKMIDLNKVISKHINPVSKQKTVIERLTMPKNGEIRKLKLERPEKNEVLNLARPLLDQINVFLFDFSRFGKTMPEREYNETMLTCGQFIENVDKFAAVVIKSETVKGCLIKLKEKFGSINVNFQAHISYHQVRTGDQQRCHQKERRRGQVTGDHQLTSCQRRATFQGDDPLP